MELKALLSGLGEPRIVDLTPDHCGNPPAIINVLPPCESRPYWLERSPGMDDKLPIHRYALATDIEPNGNVWRYLYRGQVQ